MNESLVDANILAENLVKVVAFMDGLSISDMEKYATLQSAAELYTAKVTTEALMVSLTKAMNTK